MTETPDDLISQATDWQPISSDPKGQPDLEPEKWECTIRDGRFVEPCDTLAVNTDMVSTSGRGRGIFTVTYVNMAERKTSRSMFGIKSRAHPRGGFLFNFCPFCGVDISAPFHDRDGEDDAPPSKEPSNPKVTV